MQLKSLILLFSCFFSISTLFASGEFMNAGGSSQAMGDASITTTNIWAVRNNPAAIAFLDKHGVGVYTKRPFLISGLNNASLIGAFTSSYGQFGIDINYFGVSSFNESRLGLVYARQIVPNFSAGIKLNTYLITTENNGNKILLNGELAFLYRVSKEFNLAAHLYNPYKHVIDEYADERSSSVLRFGADFSPSDQIKIAAEVLKDLDENARIKAGVNYQIIKYLSVYAGYNTEPSSFSFGFGVHYKGGHINFASNVHPILGYTPGLSIHYDFQSKP